MSNIITRRHLLQFLAVPLAGCAAEGARYQPDGLATRQGTGTIFVYRPLSQLGVRGEDPYVMMAGVSYGRMKSGSYIAATFPDSEVKVTVQQSVLMFIPTIPRSVTVIVVAGGSSYVRLNQTIDDISTSGGTTVTQSVEIEEVSLDVGQAELAETRQNS